MDDSEALDGQRLSQQQNSQIKNMKQMPFFKNPTISFVKVGHCHMCKSRNKIVYQCHKNFQSTSCEKKFCLDCLVLIYKQNIIEHLQKSDSWRCPYIRKVCRCKNCCTSRKEQYSILEIDSNLPVYTNLRQRIKSATEQEDEGAEVDESVRCLLKQKFRKVLEMNGQLITKVNTHYHKLTEEQIKFYNKLIYSNLKVINKMTKNMISHQAIIEE